VGSGHQVRSLSGRQVQCVQVSTLEVICDPDASRLRPRAAAVAARPGPTRLVVRQAADKVVPHTRELVADLVPAIAL